MPNERAAHVFLELGLGRSQVLRSKQQKIDVDEIDQENEADPSKGPLCARMGCVW
ncbi:hypothetical protein KSZ_05710 [Dictyobacter formicarum]|uniref:Uncharacterized protein n=1 Tax=Dictyobacter formicarum TaxID=2778368 RepID=A0ABQ3V8W5_9CHLR|nr:hypothetical protein KSZ_05710 [Dictyobacter formicarum]